MHVRNVVTRPLALLKNLQEWCFCLFQGLLGSWSSAGDPCMDKWSFVSCNCSDVGQHGQLSVDCLAVQGNRTALRVLSLNIPARIPGAHYVSGILSPGLAGLSELRTLHVAGQNLQVGQSVCLPTCPPFATGLVCKSGGWRVCPACKLLRGGAFNT